MARKFSDFCAQPRKMRAGDKLFEQKVEQALVGIFEETRAFRNENALGIFRRARFAKIFQDELLRAGYEIEMVNRITTALVASALSGK